MAFPTSTRTDPYVLCGTENINITPPAQNPAGFAHRQSTPLRYTEWVRIDESDYLNGQLQFVTIVDCTVTGWENRPEFGWADGVRGRVDLGEIATISSNEFLIEARKINYAKTRHKFTSDIYRFTHNHASRPLHLAPARKPTLILQNPNLNLGVHTGTFETYNKNISGSITGPQSNVVGNWAGATVISPTPQSLAGEFSGTVGATGLTLTANTGSQNTATTASLRFNPGSFTLEASGVSLDLIDYPLPSNYRVPSGVGSFFKSEPSMLSFYLLPYLTANVTISVYKCGLFESELVYPFTPPL